MLIFILLSLLDVLFSSAAGAACAATGQHIDAAVSPLMQPTYYPPEGVPPGTTWDPRTGSGGGGGGSNITVLTAPSFVPSLSPLSIGAAAGATKAAAVAAVGALRFAAPWAGVRRNMLWVCAAAWLGIAVGLGAMVAALATGAARSAPLVASLVAGLPLLGDGVGNHLGKCGCRGRGGGEESERGWWPNR